MSFFLLSMIALNGSSGVVDTFRLSLEASSAYWFSIVKYAGYAVALGCALEAPETFVILKRWWLLKFRDEERDETREDRKKWLVPLAAVGLAMIVIGICVETYAEGKVSDMDAQLRGHESDKISAAERDAGTAKDAAKAATADATIAKGDAESAGNAADRANTREAALERENAALKAKMAPRRGQR